MRIAIVSNCQADGLAAVVAFALPKEDIQVHVINRVRTPEQQQRVREAIEDAEIVVTQPLGHEFGCLATGALTDLPGRLIRIPNVFYRGFHPDLTYVGSPGSRVSGPMGDYHSLVALHGFLANMPPETCAREYDSLLGRLANPEHVAASSQTEFLRRCAEIDFPGDEFLSAAVVRDYSMFTINHPGNSIFIWIARWIFAACGIASPVPWPWLQMAAPNPLARSAIWGVPRGASRALKLDEGSEQVFRNAKGQVLTRAELIQASYSAYSRAPITALQPRRPDLDLDAVGFGEA